MPSVLNTATPDRLLAEYGVAYGNTGFVMDRILPVSPVEKQSDYYPVWGFEAFRRRIDRADAVSSINTLDYEVSKARFSLDGHSLAHFIGDDEAVDPAFDRQRDATTLLMEAILLGREAAGIEFILDSNNHSTVYSTASDLGNASTDIGAWLDARKDEVAAKCGKEPNRWAIGRDVWAAIKANSGLRTAILGTSGGVLTVDLVRQHLELDDLIVSGALYDSAQEGQTPSLARLWTAEHGVLFWSPPAATDPYGRPSLGDKVPSFGKTFVWSPGAGATDPAAAGHVGGVRVLRWRHQGEPIGTGGGTWVQVSYYYGHELTSAISGQLQTNLLGAS